MDELFQFEDLTSTFTVADVVISMVLSFVLTAIVGEPTKERRTRRALCRPWC